MRISSHYSQLVNRILTEEPGKPSGGSRKAAAREEDRKELSKLATSLQKEMEKLDGESAAQRAERLQDLADRIEQGSYYVESDKLAEAMLKFFGRGIE